MAARRVLILVGVAVACAGCGGTSSQWKAVSAYFVQVNEVQQQLRGPLYSVADAYQRYGTKGSSLEQSAPRLRAAQRTLQQLHARLAGLRAPQEAAAVHRDLVALAGQEAAFAEEVWRFAVFVPAFRRALGPLARANATFRSRLRTSTSPATQVAALRSYRRALDGVVSSLERLQPPPVLSPLHRRQISSLTAGSSAARALATALQRQDRAAVPALLARFESASAAASSLAAQRDQIAAVKSYNGRLLAMGRLAARIQRERLQLQSRLRR